MRESALNNAIVIAIASAASFTQLDEAEYLPVAAFKIKLNPIAQARLLTRRVSTANICRYSAISKKQNELDLTGPTIGKRRAVSIEDFRNVACNFIYVFFSFEIPATRAFFFAHMNTPILKIAKRISQHSSNNI